MPPPSGTPQDDAIARILRRSAVDAAPLLLGSLLTRDSEHGPVTVRITELEAYEGERDPGSHAFRGLTARNRPMFGPSGHVYVYFNYGLHVCLNLVCGEEGRASGCLVRAGEIVAGESVALERRANGRRPGSRPLRPHELARGPGSLGKALGVELTDTGRRVDAEPFHLLPAPEPVPDADIARGLRVGLAAPGGLEPYSWRFSIAGEPTVSRYTPHPTVREVHREQRARESNTAE